MITRRSFLGLIPGLGLAKGWAGGVEAIPTRKFGRHEEQVSVVGLGGILFIYRARTRRPRGLPIRRWIVGFGFLITLGVTTREKRRCGWGKR